MLSLTKEESNHYINYLYEHVGELTGYDSDLSRQIRGIMYGKYTDAYDVSVKIKMIILTTKAMKPIEYLRESKINQIIKDS